MHISEQARANVLDALDNHRLSYGRYSREFEQRFANLHDRKFACFVNSGTDALRIGLAALKERYGWADGSDVLVPALTFVATLNVVLQVGLHPVLVDIRLSDYGMDPVEVLAILGHREATGKSQPVCVLPAHLFGRPSSPTIRAIARGCGVKVLADSCETMFMPGCAEGDVSCFSTYACHLLNTGVGGIATTDDPALALLIRSLANHGRDGIYTGIDQELGSVEVINSRFRFDRPGYSSRATELEAAIGCAELDVHEAHLARRKENARAVVDGLAGLPLVLPKVEGSAHMMLPILAEQRDALVWHLEANGIETRPMLPLTSQPYIQSLYGKDVESRFPVAADVNTRGFYVASHPYLTREDIDRMINAFRDFYQR